MEGMETLQNYIVIFLSNTFSYSPPSLSLSVSLSLSFPAHSRETSSKHSISAFFFGEDLACLPRIALSALHFASIYHFIATPHISFSLFFLLISLLFYCVYGLSMCVSMIVRTQNGPLAAVITMLSFSLLNGFASSLSLSLKRLSYSFFFSEAMFSEMTLPTRHVMEVEKVSAKLFQYELDRFEFDIGIMIVAGLIFRFIALSLLHNKGRGK